MRVRVVLAIALLLAAGVFVLDMSRSAQRLAGTDHAAVPDFVATLQDGQELCQPQMVLPPHSQDLLVLIGSYGKPLPALTQTFIGPAGVVATARLPAGAREGTLQLPIGYRGGSAVAGTLCIREGAATKLVIGGVPFTASPASEQVGGKPQPGRISVIYLRAKPESWWQLLPTLSERFGLGKSSVFGGWTLAAMALLLLGVWVSTARLLLRELT